MVCRVMVSGEVVAVERGKSKREREHEKAEPCINKHSVLDLVHVAIAGLVGEERK